MPEKVSVICLMVTVALLASCSTPDKRRPPRSFAPIGAQMIKPGALLLAGFDLNADYRIDRDEFETGMLAAFSNADEDASGLLSVFEYKSWAAKALGSRDAFPAWMNVDRNYNNSVDEAEFKSEFNRFAEAYGILESDGIILADLTGEMPVAMARRGSGRGGSTSTDGGRGGRRGGGGKRGG